MIILVFDHCLSEYPYYVSEKMIYLDNAASTPIRQEAIDVMISVLENCFGIHLARIKWLERLGVS